MGNIQLLDCTLRDGGYINDWKFGKDHLNTVFEHLVNANVDIIEVGFLDDRRPFDINRSIMPDTECVEKIYGHLDKKQALVVGMIDYGTCSIENIQPCVESYLDGIRVIFKKHIMHEAMEYCRELKELGYKVFSQLVSITSYNDQELIELIDLVNDVKPYAVSMVDTYGLLHPEDLLHYYTILEEYLCEEVNIGFHAHNNFQLGYANALTFIEKETQHNIVVDGTLYGMGKSAGNAPLELLAMRLNEKYEKSYHIANMMECIEESIKEFYAQSQWGYNAFYYLCAKNKCHPNYLTYYEKKNNLSISKIDNILGMIEPEEKKLLYDKTIAEALYQKFLNGEYSDYKDRIAFTKEIAKRNILIVGPGKNIQLQKNKVELFIKEHDPYVISINYIPEEIDVDCVFVTNVKRYHDMALSAYDKHEKIRFLATSNIECRDGSFDFVINRAPLLETSEKIIDNSFLMLLRFFQSISVDAVTCAGFDGYSDRDENYYNPAMEYYFVKNEAVNLNKHMKESIAKFREFMRIDFITYSSYDAEEDIHGAAI